MSRQNHVHVVFSIPPKYSVSSLMGYLKGKLSTRLFARYEKLGKWFWGRHLCARGYWMEAMLRAGAQREKDGASSTQSVQIN